MSYKYLKKAKQNKKSRRNMKPNQNKKKTRRNMKPSQNKKKTTRNMKISQNKKKITRNMKKNLAGMINKRSLENEEFLARITPEILRNKSRLQKTLDNQQAQAEALAQHIAEARARALYKTQAYTQAQAQAQAQALAQAQLQTPHSFPITDNLLQKYSGDLKSMRSTMQQEEFQKRLNNPDAKKRATENLDEMYERKSNKKNFSDIEIKIIQDMLDKDLP